MNTRRIIFVVMLMLAVLVTGAVQAKEWVEDARHPMSMPRAAHTATLLNDGSVLIAGGMQAERALIDTAELYNAKTETFAAVANPMTVERVGHTAVLLDNGSVLIAGGWCNDGQLETAELYLPETAEFVATGSMTTARAGLTATRLDDGRVLMTGGEDTSGDINASAEVYDSQTGTFSATGSMSTARTAHTATLLEDGRVLITGGTDGADILYSAELYDPQTGTFSPAGDMTVLRYKHGAVRLNDGRVLIVGGSDNRDWGGRYRSVEIYDPATNSFAKAGNLLHKRFKVADALALLPSGNVLIAGGTTMEIYMPSEKASYGSYSLPGQEYFVTAVTVLADGGVLITGGYDSNIKSTDRAWVVRMH